MKFDYWFWAAKEWNSKHEIRNPWPRPGLRGMLITISIAKYPNDTPMTQQRRARAGRNNIKIRIFQLFKKFWVLVIWYSDLSRISIFEFRIYNVVFWKLCDRANYASYCCDTTLDHLNAFYCGWIRWGEQVEDDEASLKDFRVMG